MGVCGGRLQSAMMTCSRRPPAIPHHTIAKHAQRNGLAAEQIRSRCVRHPPLPTSAASPAQPEACKSRPQLPCCPKPILTHEAHNVAVMRPRRLNHSASRAAEVRLQRVLCRRGPFWNKGEGERRAWMEDAPLFQVGWRTWMHGHRTLAPPSRTYVRCVIKSGVRKI